MHYTIILLFITSLLLSISITVLYHRNKQNQFNAYIKLLISVYTVQYVQFEALMWKFFATRQEIANSDTILLQNFDIVKHMIGRMSTPALEGLTYQIDVNSSESLQDWFYSRQSTIRQTSVHIQTLVTTHEELDIAKLSKIDIYLKAMYNNTVLSQEILEKGDLEKLLLKDDFKKAHEQIPT